MSQNFMSSALRESLGVSHACSDAGPTTHHSMYHVLLSCPSFLKERLWLAKLYEVAPDLPFLNTVVPSGGISISVSTNNLWRLDSTSGHTNATLLCHSPSPAHLLQTLQSVYWSIRVPQVMQAPKLYVPCRTGAITPYKPPLLCHMIAYTHHQSIC